MIKKRLLILDDDEAVAKTISFIAEDLGFEVHIYDEPKLFFNKLLDLNPTHIAIDLVMPAMDGIEVLKNLASLNCKSAIIVTSGMGTKVLESAQLGAIERGLNVMGILPKPFDNQLLKDLLTENINENHLNLTNDKNKQLLNISEITVGEAIRDKHFILHYQPKINLATGKAVGFEGLMRWNHPDLGLIYPDAFIALAEKTGQIDQMTYDIINVGLEWVSHLNNQISLSLNISARSIKDDSLVDVLSKACAAYKVEPNRLILELTETNTMMDPVESLDILTRLRIRGFRLSIDDFGTGYSSMVQLARLPFSELKIDKSFVMSMDTSTESRKIVASTVQLGHSLGLTTVAEGVESRLQETGLRVLNCHLAQGYHFAKPMSGDEAYDWLKKWNS
jgi:EAL domain-containing protein (putative c-di-GMP-specific phosphodiesterase class I)/FixJ family two-component response regulator